MYVQLDWTPSRRTQKNNLPTNQKGYDNSETTVREKALGEENPNLL